MPFLDQTDQQPEGISPQQQPDVQYKNAAGFGEALKTSFENDTSVGMVSNYIADKVYDPTFPVDPNFDPFDKQNLKGYEQYADSFTHVQSGQEMALVKQRIDRELRAADITGNSGAAGTMASLLAGFTDPVNFIPVGGEASKAYRLTRAGDVIQGAVHVGAAGFVASAANEAIAQGTQETRTAGQSVGNIAATTMLSAVLGGSISGLKGGPKELPAAADAFVKDNTTYANTMGNIYGEDPMPSTAGAQAVQNTTMEQETLRSALGAEKLLKFNDPVLRTAQSPSLVTRQVAQMLAEQPLERVKNEEGIASPSAVETNVRSNWSAGRFQAHEDLEDAFLKYRTGETDPSIIDKLKLKTQDFTGNTAGKMSYDDFSEAVGQAMRRGDQHEIPEVQEAAQSFRKNVFDPLKQEAIKNKLLPEDVNPDTADSYLTRLYDVPKIVAERPQFEGTITTWLKQQQSSAAKDVGFLQPELEKHQDIARSTGTDLEANRNALRMKGDAHSETRAKLEKNVNDLKAADKIHQQNFKAAQEAKGRVDELNKQMETARQRVVQKAIDEGKLSPEGGKLKQKGDTLLQFLRKNGGLEDNTELRAMDVHKVRGLVKKDGGLKMDEAARLASEAGYIGKVDERADINTFLEAVRRDQTHGDVVIDHGPTGNRNDVNVKAADKYFEEHFDTSKLRGKIAEAEKAAREAESKIEPHASKVRDLQQQVDEQSKYKKQLNDELGSLKEDTENLDKTNRASSSKAAYLEKSIDFKRELTKLDELDLKDISAQVTDHIVGMSRGRAPYEPVPLKRGPMKERVLAIADAAIEPWLESDVRRIGKIYSRTMGTDIELTKTFGRADMQDTLDKIRDSYAVLREKTTDPKDLKKLDAQERSDLTDVQGIRDRLRGTYAMPADPNGMLIRGVKIVKNLNFLRLLGGMVLMGVSHVGNIAIRNGVAPIFKDGLVPLIQNFKGFRLAADEAKLAGTASEMLAEENLMSIGDVLDDYGRTSKFERGLDYASHKFGLVTLMAPWIATMKQFSGLIVQNNMLRAITDMASADPKQLRRLAFLGIDAPMAQRIAAEFKENGVVDRGIYQANTQSWQDVEALNKFRGALSKEINIQVVTPGQEKPLWMSTTLGGVISQFHSFQMGALQRVLLAGLQQRDLATLSGAMMMTSLGMFSYWAKTPSEKLSDNWADWLAEGVDRSGLTGWMFDANNLLEKATNGRVGVSAITGKQMSRFTNRSLLAAVLGPTADLGDQAMKTTGDLVQGNFNQQDMHNIRQMMPGQNLFYLRKVLDSAEKGAANALNVPKNSSP